MSGSVGRTRSCPHCKATILESALICPQCRHHLQFGAASKAASDATPKFSALNVEGTVNPIRTVRSAGYSLDLNN